MTTITLPNKSTFAVVDERDHVWLSESAWTLIGRYAARRCRRLYGGGRIVRPTIYMHRAIWARWNGPIPFGYEVDHANCDELDNRLANLRLATHSQNIMNKRKKKNGTSRFKGVYWNKKDCRWHVQIRANGERIFLGHFTDELKAACAYDAAAQDLHGEFARHNQLKQKVSIRER